MHVIMASPVLHLRDNPTCQLYKAKLPITFYFVEYESFAAGSPLGITKYCRIICQRIFSESFFSSAKLKSSEFSAVHKADALRSKMAMGQGRLKCAKANLYNFTKALIL